MERKKILETPFAQWRRVILTEAEAGAQAIIAALEETKPGNFLPRPGEQLPLPGLHPFGYGYSAALVERTPWVLGNPPPCSGIWEYRIEAIHSKQPGGEGFLWFEPAVNPRSPGHADGTWHGITEEGRKAPARLGWHSDFCETTSWRGLAEPCPDGYKHAVPGAKIYRVPLL